MRIARSTLVEPARNQLYATFAVAFSLFVFAYSSRLGAITILAYYGVWLPLLLVDYKRLVGNPRELILPAAFTIFVILSVLWSDAPSVSLRGGIQYATHFVCAVIAARLVDLRSLTRGMVLGVFVVVLYSLAFGYSAYDAMDGSYTFVGAFGSKNQLGLFCSLGVYFVAVLVLVMRETQLVKAGALALGALFSATLMASHSATSVIALAISLMAFVALLGFLRFSPGHRLAMALLLVPAAALVVIAALRFGAADAVLGAFGKDTTLTGRTYLWDVGIRAALDHPLLGVGYQAYWVQGFPEAERLWAEFFITSRTGFHFHNTYIESFVELGALGTALLVLMLLTMLLRLVVRIVVQRDSEAAILLGLLALFLVRSMSEVDFLFPYTVGSFLIFLLSIMARRPREAPPVPLRAARAPLHTPHLARI
ncbi:O-antigen ligase family protein [Aureimonas mangrovi]|uniref:O-antigen ligase family protein n=1 Tax=Aureimonas mangrovi TaxID=2758041 RepID=UPI00163D57BB|nr:O-antigen ligase [Aureimonas mangrovi]